MPNEEALSNTASVLPFHSPVQEHHIDFLLEEEFAVNPAFLSFFLDHAKQHFDSTWTPREQSTRLTPASSWNCHAIRSATTNAGETDVLVIYQCEQQSSKVAILIEDKVHAGFQKDQANRYKIRGEAGKLAGHWDHFFTCLVSPEKYSKHSAGFDTRVPLESIAQFFHDDANQNDRTRFKAAVFDRALSNFAATTLQNVDPVMTAFRAFYADQAASFFVQTQVRWEHARDAWYDDSWFNFTHRDLSPKTKIIHKTKKGSVELTVSKSEADSIAASVSEIPAGVTYRRKDPRLGATFSISVSNIFDFVDHQIAIPALLAAFDAVNEMVELSHALTS